MKTLLRTILFAFCISLTGCMSPSIRSNATQFHTLPDRGAGQTFAFLPNENQRSSIEYQTYCKLIIPHLQDYGWNYVDSINGADFLVYFDYGIDNGETTSGTLPLFGQTGGGLTTNTGTVTTNNGQSATYSGLSYTQPTYGQTGSIPYNVTNYNREFHISIIDAKKSTDKNIVTVYEGRVKSRGSCGEISEVLPYMIESLFKRFPGISGKSTTVELDFKNN